MFKLYARKGAGSLAVEALMAECGAAYEIIDVLRDPTGSLVESYRVINPRSEVPALMLPDNSIMTESAAMMIYIADLHPDAGLAPVATSPLRAQYLRWILNFAAAIYTADLRLFYPDRYSTEASHADCIKAKAVSDMQRDFALFADALGSGPYILGDKMSAADIYAAMLFSWAPDVPKLFDRHPNIQALYDLVKSRPKIAKVWARNETI